MSIRCGDGLPAWWALHVLALFTIAVAQPLYQVLGHPDHAPFFVEHRSTAADIVLMIVGVSILAPAILCLLVALVRLFSHTASRALYLVIVLSLFWVAFLPIGARIADGIACLILSTVAAGLATAVYTRIDLVRSFVSVLSIAALVSASIFAASPTVRPLLQGAGLRDLSVVSAAAASPDIVVIVFDELPLVSLLDERREIDAVRYPGFGRLAKTSTWYRNAATTHYVTTGAIASLLVGGEYAKYLRELRRRSPTKSALLDRSNAPDNLFSMLEEHYDVFAFETTSMLAPEHPDVAALAPPLGVRLRLLIVDTAVLFAHIVAPQGLRGSLPVIEGQWSNFLGPKTAPQTDEWRYGGAGLRVKEFRDLLRTSSTPSMFYLHVLTPHFPFIFNERGQLHTNIFRFITEQLRRATGSNDWPSEVAAQLAQQAHLLQLGYTDLLLGLILDRLDQVGILEDAMLIVTADHGITFHWDESLEGTEDLAEIQASETLLVPLFVKFPGQATAVVSDDPVQTIDILPTVAEIAGATVSWEIDGISLRGRVPADRQRIAYFPSRKSLPEVIDPEHRALARKIELFGSGAIEDVYRMGPVPELIGEPLSSIAARDSSATYELFDAARYRNVNPEGPKLPAYVQGVLRDARAEARARPCEVAIAVNGVVRGTGRCTDRAIRDLRAGAETDGEPGDNGGDYFTVRVPPGSFQAGQNRVSVYLIAAREPGNAVELVRLLEEG